MSSEKRGLLITIFATVSWGISGVMGDYLMSRETVSPDALTCFRMIGAGVILLLWIRGRRGSFVTEMLRDRGDLKVLLFFSLAGLTAIQYTFLLAIKYSNGGTATVLQYLGPIFVLVYLCARDRRLPLRREVVALTLAFLGIFFLATGGNIHALILDPRGLFYGIMASVCTVVYVVAPDPLLKKYGTLPVIGWGMLLGGLTFFLVSRPVTDPFAVSLPGALMLFAMILFGTAIPYGLYLEGVKLLGPVKTGMLAALEPVSAIVISAAFMSAHFSFGELFGMVLILLAVKVLG